MNPDNLLSLSHPQTHAIKSKHDRQKESESTAAYSVWQFITKPNTLRVRYVILEEFPLYSRAATQRLQGVLLPAGKLLWTIYDTSITAIVLLHAFSFFFLTAVQSCRHCLSEVIKVIFFGVCVWVCVITAIHVGLRGASRAVTCQPTFLWEIIV